MQSQKATLISSFPVTISTKTDKVRKDRRSPMIRDILVLTEDRILLSDFSNGIKCFDSNGTPLSKVSNIGPSTSMTPVSDTRIAFTVPFDCHPETVFIDLDLESGCLTQTFRVHTPTNYRAIGSIDEQTWAAGTAWWNGAGAVDVLNMKGEVVRSYNHPDKDKTLLSCSTDLIVTPNGDFVICDGNACCVLWLDPKAEDNPVKCRFDGEKEEKLKLPVNLACDKLRRIYVADKTLNHVLVLSPDGCYIQTILDSENVSLCQPAGVYVHQDRLYVAETEGYVKIFQLTNV